jgi:zinc transport system substrate-binding protein
MRFRFVAGGAGARLVTCAAIALSVISLAACGEDRKPASADGKVDAVAGFYPLQFATARIGGDRVSVTNLVQPGTEPHDLELKPSQIIKIANADLVVYLHGLQPELDKAVAEDRAKGLDVTTISPLVGGDPHVWLDPVRFAAIADAIAARLAELDPGHAADYAARGAALHDELTQLDSEFAAGLKTCLRHEIFTSHAAFGYPAKRYGLQQIALTGLSPDTEPTPKHLAEVAQQARDQHATTIFFEALVSPRVARTLATEVGAKAAVLDPIEGLEPGSAGDYLSVMRGNLAALRDALGCS